MVAPTTTEKMHSKYLPLLEEARMRLYSLRLKREREEKRKKKRERTNDREKEKVTGTEIE